MGSSALSLGIAIRQRVKTALLVFASLAHAMADAGVIAYGLLHLIPLAVVIIRITATPVPNGRSIAVAAEAAALMSQWVLIVEGQLLGIAQEPQVLHAIVLSRHAC